MNKLKLLDDQTQIEGKIAALIAKGESEKRSLDTLENSELARLKSSLESTKSALEAIEREERSYKPQPQKKATKSFSLIAAIQNEAERRSQPDEFREILDAGIKEFRGNSSLEMKGQLQIPIEYRGEVVAASSPAVAENKFSIIEPLRGALVSVQAGAKLLTGLVGNVSMPEYSGSNATWEDETAEASDGAGTISDNAMSPKRLTTFIDISKQFLLQDSVNANALLISDLTAAIGGKLEATIFGKHAHATKIPDGFFTGTPTYAVSGAADWAKVVAMETGVDVSNALQGNLGYITHPSLRGKMKTTAKASNQAIFLLDSDGKANGYPVFSTTHMSSALQTGTDEYGILFGNWAELLIGQWGAIDLTVDPYSQATKGKIRLIINAYFDVKKRRSASFAIGSLK